MAAQQPGTEPKTFVENARELVTSIRADASLTAMLKEVYERYVGGGVPPSDYLWVTDVVNPVAGYHARKHPMHDPPELVEIFAQGKAIHRQAKHWFRGLPGFVLNEGKVDGGYVGLDGVVGSVDFLLGKGVLEFKTKGRAPRTPEDVASQYPQDLEQLLFYAVLLPGVGDHHFLAFFDRSDSTFTTFRVDLLDRGVVTNLLRQRMAELRRALKTDDPSRLGRCRYFDAGCKFLQEGICPCEDLDPIDTSTLLGAVAIARDEELEWAMGKARGEARLPPGEIAWWDLISPRRWYLRREGRDPSYTPDLRKKASKEVLFRAIERVKDIRPSSAAAREARDGAWDCGVRCSLNFVLARSAKRPGGVELRPYVAQAPKGSVREAENLFPHYIAELAIRCTLAGCPRGVVFLTYPDEGNEIVAYTVSFRSIKDLRSLVEGQVKAIREAGRREDPSLLPKCEPFMRDSCTDACLCR